MQRYERSIEIQVPVEQLFAFHTDPQNLLRITPSGVRVVVLRHDPPAEGALVELRVVPLPILPFLSSRWRMRFDIYDPPRRLSDVQEKGPFRFWRQTREFVPLAHDRALMHDMVDYALPFGFLGQLFDRLFMSGMVRRMFEHRQLMTKQILETMAK